MTIYMEHYILSEMHSKKRRDRKIGRSLLVDLSIDRASKQWYQHHSSDKATDMRSPCNTALLPGGQQAIENLKHEPESQYNTGGETQGRDVKTNRYEYQYSGSREQQKICAQNT